MREQDWLEGEMRVKDAMVRMPNTVAPDASVFYARSMMSMLGVRHLPVLDRGEVVGVVSDQDLRAAEAIGGPARLAVAHAMTSAPYVVSPEEPLCDVLTEMIDRRIDYALVTSPRGVLVGIFTAQDALGMLRGLLLLGNREVEDSEAPRAA